MGLWVTQNWAEIPALFSCGAWFSIQCFQPLAPVSPLRLGLCTCCCFWNTFPMVFLSISQATFRPQLRNHLLRGALRCCPTLLFPHFGPLSFLNFLSRFLSLSGRVLARFTWPVHCLWQSWGCRRTWMHPVHSHCSLDSPRDTGTPDASLLGSHTCPSPAAAFFFI